MTIGVAGTRMVAPPTLALGSAQFGMPYGLAQPPAMTPREEVRRVLAGALAHGIDTIDTAPVYGEAEAVIGACKPEGARFTVISKTLPVGAARVEKADCERLAARVRRSVQLLRVAALDALLVHEARDLLAPGGAALFSALEGLRREGVVRRIGVSVYEPDVLEAVVERYPIEIVQLPLNALDQRFAQAGGIVRLAARGIEVHTRSVFLKGLLVRPLEGLPAVIGPAIAPAQRFRAAMAARGLSAAEGALLFALRQPGVSRIVVGIDGQATLEANLRACAAARAFSQPVDFTPFAVADYSIIDPRRWDRAAARKGASSVPTVASIP